MAVASATLIVEKSAITNLYVDQCSINYGSIKHGSNVACRVAMSAIALLYNGFWPVFLKLE